MAAPYGEKTTTTTTVVTGVAAPGGVTQWTQTLCGCTDNCSICCEECWCAYCHIGYLYDTIDKGGRDMDPLACCGTCLVDGLTGGIARCLVVMFLRKKLTERYMIPESGVRNCCTVCCCSSCAMCQMHREMDARGDYTGGCCYKAPLASAPMGAQTVIHTTEHHGHHQPQHAHPAQPAQPGVQQGYATKPL